MKAKVLIGYYPQESGFEVIRVYLEHDFEQAEKDKEILTKHCQKEFKLVECDLFNTQRLILDKTVKENS